MRTIVGALGLGLIGAMLTGDAGAPLVPLAAGLAGGTAGNLATDLFKAFDRKVAERFLDGWQGIDENHNIVSALRLAQIDALKALTQAYEMELRSADDRAGEQAGQAFVTRLHKFLKQETRVAQKRKFKSDAQGDDALRSAVLLILPDSFDQALATRRDDTRGALRDAASLRDVRNLVEHAVLAELRLNCGDANHEIPQPFEMLVLGKEYPQGWFDLFVRDAADKLSHADGEFAAIWNAEQTALVKAYVEAALSVAKETHESVEALHARVGGGIEDLARLQASVDRLHGLFHAFSASTHAALAGLEMHPQSFVARVERNRTAAAPDAEPAMAGPFEVDPRLKAYFARLERKFRYLPLQGMREWGSLEIELEKVYVALRATNADFALRERLHSAEVLDQAKARSLDVIPSEAIDDLDAQVIRATHRAQESVGGQAELESIGQLFRTHRRLVVLGGPGSGKSTLGRWIALQCARAMLEELENGKPARIRVPRHQIDFAPTTGASGEEIIDLGPSRIPIFLPVAHYARELTRREDAGAPTLSLLSYLGCDPDTEGLDDNLSPEARNACFRQLVEAGRAVIILDGLDELVDSSRRTVVPRIHEFIENHIPTDGSLPHEAGGNQILITSRRVGYELAPVRAGCAHFHIEHMIRGAVERFARSWGAAVNAELARTADPLFDSEAFIAEIYNASRPKVRELATNPLLVTILAIVFYRDGHLPEHRAELYHRIIENLLELWLARAECQRHKLKREELLAALEPLAADLQQNASRNGLVGIERLSEVMSPVLAEMRHADPDSRTFREMRDNLLNTIKDSVGLLAEQSPGNYVFFHGTFREFLAARHLLAEPREAASRIREHLDDPLWREPLLLALGFAMIDEGWGRQARTRLLTDVLLADGDGSLIPRAALTIIAALPDMPGVDPEIVRQIVLQLLRSYAGCLDPLSSDRLQVEIHTAFSKLRASRHNYVVEQSLLASLEMDGSRGAAATLMLRLDWFNEDLVEALLEQLSNDSAELDWPIRRGLTAALSETPDRPIGARLAARLQMRHRLMRDAELLGWIENDAAWLWLVVALYGGIPHHDDIATSAPLAHRPEVLAGPPILFDPRSIVNDLQDRQLSTLITRALAERQPAANLLPELEAMWRQDNPQCEGEVLVAMAALGYDISQILLSEAADRQRRVAGAIRRLTWTSRWLSPLLARNGMLALQTLPMSASERDRQHLADAAVEALLANGAATAPLAQLLTGEFVNVGSAGCRLALEADRWAFTLLDARIKPGRIARMDTAVLAAVARLGRSSALRRRRVRGKSLPALIPHGEAFREKYLALLAVLATLQPAHAGFNAGRLLGSYFERARQDLELAWITASVMRTMGSEFCSGFEFEAGEVRVTEDALSVWRALLPAPVFAAASGLSGKRFSTGSAFAHTASELLGEDTWSRVGEAMLFCISPGSLNDPGFSSDEGLLDKIVEHVSASAEGKFRPSSAAIQMREQFESAGLSKVDPAISSAFEASFWIEAMAPEIGSDPAGRVDEARYRLALARDVASEHLLPAFKRAEAAIDAVEDEAERCEIIREARVLWHHELEIGAAFDAIASRIEDPWLRNRASERTSQLIAVHRDHFERSPLQWRLRGKSGTEISFRKERSSGTLVWAAIYLSSVAREAGAVREASATREQAWLQLLGDEPARAVGALVATDSGDGIRLGSTEALILDQVAQLDRIGALEDLWPLLDAAPEALPIIARWTDWTGTAGDWVRLVQAEAGRLEPATVAGSLRLLEHPADRFRFRSALALHGSVPHYSMRQGRWSIRRCGSEALEMVARKACFPGTPPALITTLSWVNRDVQHDDIDAIADWIARARDGALPAQWILSRIDQAGTVILDTMVDAIPDSSFATQMSLLRGLCYGRTTRATPAKLLQLGVIPLEARKAEAQVKGGAAVVLEICNSTSKIADGEERLAAARLALHEAASWIDDVCLADPGQAAKRVAECHSAGMVHLASYWTDARRAARSLTATAPALGFLLQWLDAERLAGAHESILGDLLAAVEALASTNDEPIIAAIADPEHWEPILADWAEFMPSWKVRMPAISVLGRLRRVSPRVVPALAAAMADVDLVQVAAFEAAGRFRAVDGDILPAVLALLDGASAATAASAARFLMAISRGDGEFVDRRKIFLHLQASAVLDPARSVYLQWEALDRPMGFEYLARLNRILRDAALAVGRF